MLCMLPGGVALLALPNAPPHPLYSVGSSSPHPCHISLCGAKPGFTRRALWVPWAGGSKAKRKSILRNRQKRIEKWKRKGKERRQSNVTVLTGNIHRDLLVRDRYQCQYCGARGVHLTIDHVISKARGGTTSMNNLVVACRRCNQLKAAMSIKEAAERHKTKTENIKRTTPSNYNPVSQIDNEKEDVSHRFRNPIGGEHVLNKTRER
eukprot:jgi/Bigna1/86959/estExt_fgenesh1_pg.C_150176